MRHVTAKQYDKSANTLRYTEVIGYSNQFFYIGTASSSENNQSQREQKKQQSISGLGVKRNGLEKELLHKKESALPLHHPAC